MSYGGLQHLYRETSLKNILSSFGEGKSCVLTDFYSKVDAPKPTSKLMVVTVDAITADPLFSNLACVYESYAAKWAFNVTYKITHELGTVHFRSPMDFYEYNKSMLAKVNIWDFTTLTNGFPRTDENLVLLWDFLTQNHVKGIEQIDFLAHGVSIDQEAMKFWRGRKRAASASSIATLSSPSGIII